MKLSIGCTNTCLSSYIQLLMPKVESLNYTIIVLLGFKEIILSFSNVSVPFIAQPKEHKGSKFYLGQYCYFVIFVAATLTE